MRDLVVALVTRVTELEHTATAQRGICTNCDHRRRICNFTGIIESQLPQFKNWINVIVFGEELGT